MGGLFSPCACLRRLTLAIYKALIYLLTFLSPLKNVVFAEYSPGVGVGRYQPAAWDKKRVMTPASHRGPWGHMQEGLSWRGYGSPAKGQGPGLA